LENVAGAVGVLLEGTPSDVNVAALREAISKIDGVRDVHDLHIWSLTSGVNAMSLHVVVDDDRRHAEILRVVSALCDVAVRGRLQ